MTRQRTGRQQGRMQKEKAEQKKGNLTNRMCLGIVFLIRRRSVIQERLFLMHVSRSH